MCWGPPVFPFEHLHRDRPSLATAEQAIDDLQPIRLAITAVVMPGEFAA
jgi:hypothetical protein